VKVIRTVREMRNWSLAARAAGKRVGFVPTMGYLHEGHMSLVRLAREHSDRVAVSIFVNPIQFGPGEDFSRYPRDFARDEALCEREGVAAVFYPEPDEMYAADHSVTIDENKLTRGLCGRSRPGHFRGVLTVVGKLFNIVLPDVAVFGQKDAQQVSVIQRMVTDLNFPVEIIVGPILREPDGLAMSSRNKYLSAAERLDALCLSQSLKLAESLYRDGVRSVRAIRDAISDRISTVPTATVEYIELVDAATLDPVEEVRGPVLVALAVRVGRTRLIDNTVLGR
jgi:pantoate--beta-alanine ligase